MEPLGFDGPPGAAVSYLGRGHSRTARVDDEATVQCSDCYQVEVQRAGTRPATHWDATLVED